MDNSTDYERTVHAALSETRSKFALAEALALDIAPRRGRPANGVSSTDRQLTEARMVIIEAGGEPRSTSTLRNYRLTALWVKNPKTGEFRWLEGRSWSAHDEARQRGLSYGEFTRLPADAGVTVIREMGMQRQPAGAPFELVIQPDPSVELVFQPEPAIGQGIAPVTFLPPGEEAPEPGPAPQPQSAPAAETPRPELAAAPEPEPEPKPQKPLNLVTAVHGLRKPVARIAAEVEVNGVSVADRGPMLAELEDVIGALEAVRKSLRESGRRIRAV